MISYKNYFNPCLNIISFRQVILRRDENSRIRSIKIVNHHQTFVKFLPSILLIYFHCILSIRLHNPKSDRIGNRIYKPSFFP